jgi:ubiquinone/menaquinone biosynthesis C-methylase UbiE
MRVKNHSEHNNNPEYWDVLLGPVKSDPARWNGKNALDFGCGCGRNVFNLASLAEWSSVDGCDISAPNCEETRILMEWDHPKVSCQCFPTNGYELNEVPSNNYDFVMSTITLQHICVHEIRFSILSDIFRVMKPGGLLSFQVGFGESDNGFSRYYDNSYEVRRTNSGHDVMITDPQNLIDDLRHIGFTEISYQIGAAWEGPEIARHPHWLFVKATKPL